MHAARTTLAAGLIAFGLAAGAAARGADSAGPGEARVLGRIHAPVFQGRAFSIADFGAAPGRDATAAIRAAIEACSRAGGGRVVVPAGEWETGAIRLLRNVEFHLDPGAILRFSTNPSDYPTVFTRFEGVECMNTAPLIYALGQENVAVTGEGILDGQASDANWWGWTRKGTRLDQPDREALFRMGEDGIAVERRVFGPGHHLRPDFIEFVRCRNVLIEGVRIVRSPMWEIHPLLCENVTVRGVWILSHGKNNDGCDPESSRDVLIEDCTFDTGDDCIAIKSGRNNDGRRVGIPSENIVVRGCTMRDGHGGVVIGSEISGGCRNVYVDGCLMDSPRLNYALRIKSNASRGGFVENVFMRDTGIGSVADAALIVDLLYEEGARGNFPPVVRNIWMENVSSEHSETVCRIDSFERATVAGIHIHDSTFRGVAPAGAPHTGGAVELSGVTVNPPRDGAVAPADAVVALDGSGQYTSVQDAINAAPIRSGPGDRRWVILVKPGIYRERVYVQRERGNLLLEGGDPARTIIACALHASLPGPDGRPIGTFHTPTVQVDADGFAALNISFVNESGPVGQAVALRVDGDRDVFRGCRILGWQDSLLVNRGRQVFEGCLIEGTVDFIFGGATAYFDHCHIHCLADGTITAASTPQGAFHGLVFADCRITGGEDVRTYLGRPWRDFAQVSFLRTDMSGVVRPEGWNDWRKPEAHATVRFGECGSTGPGAGAASRVPWSRAIPGPEAEALTLGQVVGGADGWKPSL